MLIAAVCILGVTFSLGLWLGYLTLLLERPPPRLTWVGALHGLAGAAGLSALFLALQGPPRGVKYGAGTFGNISAALLVAALAGGLTVLVTRARGRAVPFGVVALHGLFAIAGYTLLCTYLTMAP
jgi:hypothetical protein